MHLDHEQAGSNSKVRVVDKLGVGSEIRSIPMTLSCPASQRIKRSVLILLQSQNHGNTEGVLGTESANCVDKLNFLTRVGKPQASFVLWIEARGAADGTFFIQTPIGPPSVPPPATPTIALTKHLATDEQLEGNTEFLGSQTIEGVIVNGVRTTHTIPVGQVGNDRPISIVTEVWTSTDLKTIISSKRNDPRMGEQTFRLTNIVRTEPDPSLFTVPADFKIIDGPKTIIYRRNQ